MQPSEGLDLKECLVQLYFLLFSGLKFGWSKIFNVVFSVSLVLPTTCCYNVKVKSCFLVRMSFTLLEINQDRLIAPLYPVIGGKLQLLLHHMHILSLCSMR